MSLFSRLKKSRLARDFGYLFYFRFLLTFYMELLATHVRVQRVISSYGMWYLE